MWRQLALAGIAVLAFHGSPALAGDVMPGADLLTCTAARSDVARVAVENLHYGFTTTYLWATGTVRVALRNHGERAYALTGRAVPFNRLLAPNAADASFAYPEFKCVVQYPFITAVKNCSGSGLRRTCNVGLDVWGTHYSYAVSLVADRVKTRIREASVFGVR